MFITGLSLTFTAFGTAAGLLGTLFGVVGRWWYVAAGAVALVMGGQLLGLYTIRLPVRRDFKPKQGGFREKSGCGKSVELEQEGQPRNHCACRPLVDQAGPLRMTKSGVDLFFPNSLFPLEDKKRRSEDRQTSMKVLREP